MIFFQINSIHFVFRANQSSSHDSEAVHVASNQKRRWKWVDRQARGPRLLPPHDSTKTVVHGTKEKNQDWGLASGSRISVSEFGNCFQSHEPCHAVQKSKPPRRFLPIKTH
jgi:hypothetical protein